jgi:hypothetical protein
MSDVLRSVDRFEGLAGDPACRDYIARATARPAFEKARADQFAHFAAADRKAGEARPYSVRNLPANNGKLHSAGPLYASKLAQVDQRFTVASARLSFLGLQQAKRSHPIGVTM